jgi:hypothetical protein
MDTNSAMTSRRKIFIAAMLMLAAYFLWAAVVSIRTAPSKLIHLSGTVSSVDVLRTSGGRSGSSVYAVRFCLTDADHCFYYNGPYLKDLATDMKPGKTVELAHDATTDQNIWELKVGDVYYADAFLIKEKQQRDMSAMSVLFAICLLLSIFAYLRRSKKK